MNIEFSLRGLLSIFFRQQIKFGVAFALVLLVGLVYISGVKRVYEAHGSFLIKSGQNAVPDVSRDGAGHGMMDSEHTEMMQSNMRILESENLLASVVNKVGVERMYPGLTKSVLGADNPVHAAVEALTRSLSITNDPNTSLVKVSYRNKNPEVAKEFVETLVQMFIAHQASIYMAPQTTFLKEQAEEVHAALRENQKKFQAFKREAGISNLDEEVKQLLAERTALSGVALQAVTTAQAALSKLEGERAAATATYNTDSPIVQRLDDSIAIARSEVEKRQKDLSAAGDDDSELSPKIAKIEDRMTYLEEHRGDYEALEQTVKVGEENYKHYIQLGESARGSEVLNQQGITRIAVVDKPTVPMKSQPRKRVLLLIAFLMTATLAGLGAALFFELTDERIAYPEQIPSAVGLPVLASFGGGA